MWPSRWWVLDHGPVPFGSLIGDDGLRRCLASREAGTGARLVAEAWAAQSLVDWLALGGRRSAFALHDLARIREAPTSTQQALLAIASLSTNGRVREAVVAMAAELADPAALPWLLPRLVDWVPQVRAAAAALVTKLVPALAPPALVELGAGVARWLLAQQRDEAGQFGRVLAAALSAPECRALVVARVLASRAGGLPFTRILFGAGDDLPLAVALLHAAEPTVRQWIAGRLASRAAELDPSTVEFLMGRAGPEARARFLIGLDPALAARFEPQLRAACGSRQRRVRTAAQWHLGRLGVDVPTFVAERLAVAPEREVPAWLLSLGECGDRSRGGELRAWLSAAESRHRRAALLALQRLEGDAVWDLAVDRLGEGDAGEAKTAAWVLQRTRRSVWVEAVRGLTRSTDPVVVDRAHDLLTRDGGRAGWRVVPDLMNAILESPRPDRFWRRFAVAVGGSSRAWSCSDAGSRAALRRVWPRWRARELVPPPEFALVIARCEREIVALIAIP